MARKTRRRRRRATASGRVRRNPARRSKKAWHHKKGTFTYNARRRRRRSGRVTARRGRRHRRNPIAVRGLVGQVIEAGKHAVVIVLATAGVNKVSSLIPIGGGSVPMAIAKQIGVGIALAALTRRFAPRFANDVLIAALLAPAQTLVRQIPGVGTALAGAPPGLGVYSGRPVNLRGAPPGLGRGMGDYGGRDRSGAAGLPASAYFE